VSFSRRERHHSEGDQKLETASCSGVAILRGPYASDHQFVGDAAYINLEIEALHKWTGEMRRPSPRGISLPVSVRLPLGLVPGLTVDGGYLAI
jgi:hypothetical protein